MKAGITHKERLDAEEESLRSTSRLELITSQPRIVIVEGGVI